ncbi:polysaccharide deacetylase family protein [Streptomyces otsuchiensis]|uniref:polysaccharide deacetylase family protein n=1 Tax=Streptomyces otsuchiensis TaxID=2681388 RepID=UPI001D130E5A|nr:polysaccharide deacetylase family protein [Streptomyces otsuchiensis]
MTSDSSDKTPFGRRVVLGAAACAGLVGLNRLLTSADRRAAGDTFAAMSPTGDPSAEDPAGAPGRRPVEVRTAADRTLDVPGRRIALTFDDGPHPEHTPQVLRVLRQHGVTATFFVIGENAERHPDLLRAVADEGHLVANHSWTHPQLTRLSRTAVREELGRTSDLLASALGAAPRWARAPYGAWDRASLGICADLGMVPLGWSIDTNDWAAPGVGAISTAVLDGAHSGAVVLVHDGGGDRSQTVSALGHYLPRLIDRGYQLVQPV